MQGARRALLQAPTAGQPRQPAAERMTVAVEIRPNAAERPGCLGQGGMGGIEHRLTSPNHSQTNGTVERFDGRIRAMLQSHHFRSCKRTGNHAAPRPTARQPAAFAVSLCGRSAANRPSGFAGGCGRGARGIGPSCHCDKSRSYHAATGDPSLSKAVRDVRAAMLLTSRSHPIAAGACAKAGHPSARTGDREWRRRAMQSSQ